MSNKNTVFKNLKCSEKYKQQIIKDKKEEKLEDIIYKEMIIISDTFKFSDLDSTTSDIHKKNIKI